MKRVSGSVPGSSNWPCVTGCAATAAATLLSPPAPLTVVPVGPPAKAKLVTAPPDAVLVRFCEVIWPLIDVVCSTLDAFPASWASTLEVSLPFGGFDPLPPSSSRS